MDISTLCAVLWTAFALATGLVLSKLMKIIHFPNVTGFLIGGILIGPWVFGNIIQQREAMADIVNSLSFMSEIALGFIAFTIGGSFKVSALKKVGKRATVISVAEALAIQSLPKEYELPLNVSLTDAFKTIGNGVPYELAKGVALSINDYINSNSK